MLHRHVPRPTSAETGLVHSDAEASACCATRAVVAGRQVETSSWPCESDGACSQERVGAEAMPARLRPAIPRPYRAGDGSVVCRRPGRTRPAGSAASDLGSRPHRSTPTHCTAHRSRWGRAAGPGSSGSPLANPEKHPPSVPVPAGMSTPPPRTLWGFYGSSRNGWSVRKEPSVRKGPSARKAGLHVLHMLSSLGEIGPLQACEHEVTEAALIWSPAQAQAFCPLPR